MHVVRMGSLRTDEATLELKRESNPYKDSCKCSCEYINILSLKRHGVLFSDEELGANQNALFFPLKTWVREK